MALNTIYALVDPRTHEIRYVGKSRNPQKRLNGHLTEARRYNRGELDHTTHKIHWIAQVLADGQRPVLETLAVVDDDSWSDAERGWIAYLRTIGCVLTNGDDGGVGWMPKTTVAYVSPQRGKPRTVKEREQISVTLRERLAEMPDEERDRRREQGRVCGQSNRGRKLTPEHLAAFVMTNLGKPRTQEAIAKQKKTLSQLTAAERSARARKTWEARRHNGTDTWAERNKVANGA